MGDVVGLVTTLVEIIAVAVIGSFAFNELLEWQPHIRNLLLRKIVDRLPEAERAIRMEEWAAHMDECPGTLSKLLLLLSFGWAGHNIAREFERQDAAQRKVESKKASTPAEPSNPGGLGSAVQPQTELWQALEVRTLNKPVAGQYELILRHLSLNARRHWSDTQIQEATRNFIMRPELMPNQDFINMVVWSWGASHGDKDGEL